MVALYQNWTQLPAPPEAAFEEESCSELEEKEDQGNISKMQYTLFWNPLPQLELERDTLACHE